MLVDRVGGSGQRHSLRFATRELGSSSEIFGLQSPISRHFFLTTGSVIPMPSMYGISTDIWLIFMVNVGYIHNIPYMDPMGYRTSF